MSTARILFVEPDVLVRHPLAEYLRECGYQVLEAQDADEAAQLLGNALLPVDVMLVEGEAGLGLARLVRRDYPEVEVLLAGNIAKAAETAAELCQEGPALVVPYEHHLVLARIKQLLAARTRAKR